MSGLIFEGSLFNDRVNLLRTKLPFHLLLWSAVIKRLNDIVTRIHVLAFIVQWRTRPLSASMDILELLNAFQLVLLSSDITRRWSSLADVPSFHRTYKHIWCHNNNSRSDGRRFLCSGDKRILLISARLTAIAAPSISHADASLSFSLCALRFDKPPVVWTASIRTTSTTQMATEAKESKELP